MPTARESSIGLSRRGPPKTHIPFRGDNPEVGKKTGIAVKHVERKSDGFEPFEDIMLQADKRTPPTKVRGKKRRQTSPSPVVEDENGEKSMDMDDSNPNSPMKFFARSRLSVALQGPNRVEDFDHHPQQNGSPDWPSPAQTSFVQIDQEDEEDYNYDQDMPVQASNRKDKGKERAKPPDEENEEELVHEEILQSLNDIQPNASDNDEEDLPPPSKKPRTETQPPKRPRSRPKKINVPIQEETVEELRRGKRHRYRPLEWWRQEKVVYGKRESGISFVPHIKSILRIPKEDPVPLGGKHKGKKSRKMSSRKSETAETMLEEMAAHNPEEGWDDNTPQQGTVLDFATRQEVERRVAFTAKMVEPQAAANNDWYFQKVFGDGDFIAAGQLIIPPKGRKPSKGAKDNTYIFYVIEGAVNLKLHNTSVILATGGMFMVPRGNTYFIENIADRDAKLFFTQARKTAMTEEEQAASVFLLAGTPSSERRSSEVRRMSGSQVPQPQLTAHKPGSVGAESSGRMNGHSSVAGDKSGRRTAEPKRAATTKS